MRINHRKRNRALEEVRLLVPLNNYLGFPVNTIFRPGSLFIHDRKCACILCESRRSGHI